MREIVISFSLFLSLPISSSPIPIGFTFQESPNMSGIVTNQLAGVLLYSEVVGRRGEAPSVILCPCWW
jgi:hypothetical protein